MIRFNDNFPIYQQICSYFEAQLLSGKLKTGDKLSSVRDLATELGVNPNTIQKSLALMESRNLMHSERTSGRFITNDQDAIEALRSRRIIEISNLFFDSMRQIGYGKEEAIRFLQNGMPEANDANRTEAVSKEEIT